jgi:hypothetical protein
MHILSSHQRSVALHQMSVPQPLWCIKCLCHNRCGALLLGADESFPGPVSYKEEFARLKVKEAEMLRDVPTFILLNV